MKRKEVTVKSKRGRNESLIKKNRPFEVRSQSMETVVQGTEQQLMPVHCQPMETVMLSTEQQIESYGVLLEILSRLPVKSLIRFMCVCKHWKSLISSRPLRKLHCEKHTSSPPLVIASYSLSESNLEFDFPIIKRNYLLTFDLERRFVHKITVPIPFTLFYMRTPPYQSKLLYFVNFDLKKSYLYNPSTQQPFLLPNPSCFSLPEFERHCNAIHHCSAAYGYIPSKDEYIMVHLLKLSNGNLVCEVLDNISISSDNFKLNYGEWRSSTEATIMLKEVTGSGVFVGGAFYWIALNWRINPKFGFILSFDVKADSFTTIDYPQDLLDYYGLLNINNELYLTYYPESPAILVMWKWSFDNKLWSQDWKFDFEKLFGFIGGAPYHTRFFSYELFIYTLKYLKGYEDQPPDDQVSYEMGELRLEDDMQMCNIVAVHTNMFTL